jgi:3-phosphoglycerate kinase
MQINNENEICDKLIIIKSLGNRNPGAYTVASKIFDLLETDDSKTDIIIPFINKLLDKEITGSRLWYIYKNEAKLNVSNLVELDLLVFDNTYFYDKFEKYTQNC